MKYIIVALICVSLMSNGWTSFQVLIGHLCICWGEERGWSFRPISMASDWINCVYIIESPWKSSTVGFGEVPGWHWEGDVPRGSPELYSPSHVLCPVHLFTWLFICIFSNNSVLVSEVFPRVLGNYSKLSNLRGVIGTRNFWLMVQSMGGLRPVISIWGGRAVLWDGAFKWSLC